MSLRSHEAAACAVIAIGVCGVLVGSLLVESMRNGQSSAKATVSTAQSTEEVQAQTEPTQAPAPTPEPEPVVQTVHFSATGDNLIHEGIYNQARARGSDGHYDFIPAYENLRDFYAGFDVNWLNQETLVNDDYEPSGYPMFSTPGDITNAQDMPDNMIGAILDVTFQKTTAADGTVTVEIQNPVLHPVITQYEPHYANIRVYLYKDYTDELGAAHGNFALSRASIEQVLNGSIDSEFLSLE